MYFYRKMLSFSSNMPPKLLFPSVSPLARSLSKLGIKISSNNVKSCNNHINTSSINWERGNEVCVLCKI